MLLAPPCPAAPAWHSQSTGRTLPLTVYGAGQPTDPARPLVLYLQNLAAPRVGAEPDEAILAALRADGNLVVAVDFAGHPRSKWPHLNRDLAQLRDDLLHGRLLADQPIDQSRVYVVPSGCRLLRDTPFYTDGGRTLAMDVIYPSQPKQPVGAVLEFSCDNQHRMGNGSLAICSDTVLDGLAAEGFAVAMADHPVAAPYKGLDPMPDSAWKIKAAVRTLRAQAERLPLSGQIGVVGFSRGSGMALMLATTAGRAEFEGRGRHTGESSSVQAAVIMSGRFTYLDLLEDDHMLPRYAAAWGERATHRDAWRAHGALDYLTAPTIPLLLTINTAEGPDALHQMKVLRDRLTELSSPFQYLPDTDPRGHKVTLDPEILREVSTYLRASLR